MRRPAAVLACALLAAPAAPAAPLAGSALVSDGDSLILEGTRIRLWGIDAPERGARCGGEAVGRKARSALVAALGDRAVTCKIRYRDRFDTRWATCRAGEQDLGQAVIRRGWAVAANPYGASPYRAAERAARQAERGLHGLGCAGP